MTTRILSLKSLLLVFVALFAVGCFTTTPLKSPFSAPIRQEADTKTMMEALKDTGAKRGWKMTPGAAADEMIGELQHRSHFMKIKFKCADGQISATYLDSQDMSYDGSNIHKKYHMWLSAFFRDYNKILSQTVALAPPAKKAKS